MSANRSRVTQDYLDARPIPHVERGEKIARVVGARGGSLFEISLPDGEISLALLPTRFNDLIYIKRHDHLIVSNQDGDITSNESDNDEKKSKNKVHYLIHHILHTEQENYIKERGLWPIEFMHDGEHLPEVKEGENEDDLDDDIPRNTNRDARNELYNNLNDDDDDDDDDEESSKK